MRALVTGGAGYIGAHLVLTLLEAGHTVTVIDDFSGGHLAALERVQTITGRSCGVIAAGVADPGALPRALDGVEVVFHLAASKLVDASMSAPERYFLNNLGGMAALLDGMERAGVRRIVYSSSAAVYGTHARMTVGEDSETLPENPYGLTKLHGEQMLAWMCLRREWSAVSLRYFNPVGAHASGRIGQPVAAGVALVPRALQALLTGRPMTVYGTDWPTPDGTCLRDYIHIEDLSRAHLLAVQALNPGQHLVYNVGTGRPHSVQAVLAACGRAAGRAVPVTLGSRRPGDIACATADARRFQQALGFSAQLGLDEMVVSAWRWSCDNPAGYQ